jgi:hypothetical protein
MDALTSPALSNSTTFQLWGELSQNWDKKELLRE